MQYPSLGESLGILAERLASEYFLTSVLPIWVALVIMFVVVGIIAHMIGRGVI